jgi:adenosylmethionine-8-amino-7-oxononanoate aminotransferase
MTAGHALRRRIVEADKRRLWHPYTPMGDWLEHGEPLVVARARGARLWDVDGRELLDGNSSWWAAVLGHGHPRLVERLRRQSEQLCHTSLAGVTHEAAALLAEELIQAGPPGMARVFFSDDGSTAVEVAMKLALQLWQIEAHPRRRRFVALDGAFHGETLGVTALGGVELFRRPFAGALLDCIHVPPGEAGHARAFAALERVIADGADEIAAVVLEPVVQGAAGMRVYDPAYVAHARELTRRHELLLVLDEVFTGYGRTGPMWAAEHAGTSADIVCLAKGMTGGMLPFAATLVTERVFEPFRGGPERTFWYGHTYCGNPLGAALAREVLAVYRDEQVLERARPKAERIRRAFEAMRELPGVAGTRSLGMIGALDLAGDAGYLAGAGWRVYREALQRGAYLRPLGNVVYVTPPINIADDELERLLAIAAEAVSAAATPNSTPPAPTHRG